MMFTIIRTIIPRYTSIKLSFMKLFPLSSLGKSHPKRMKLLHIFWCLSSFLGWNILYFGKINEEIMGQTFLRNRVMLWDCTWNSELSDSDISNSGLRCSNRAVTDWMVLWWLTYTVYKNQRLKQKLEIRFPQEHTRKHTGHSPTAT